MFYNFFGVITVSIRVLIWVQAWKREFNKFLTCNKMVHMMKGAMTGERFDERQGKDPLEDTASHMPLGSHQSRLREFIGLNSDTDLSRLRGYNSRI